MREKLELDKDLVMSLPNDGEQYGTDNLAIVASFAGRSFGKYTRYMKDERIDFIEGLGIYKIVRQAGKTQRKVDFQEMRYEYNDLVHDEREELKAVATKEYFKALGEEESTADILDGIMEDFFDLTKLFGRLGRKRA